MFDKFFFVDNIEQSNSNENLFPTSLKHRAQNVLKKVYQMSKRSEKRKHQKIIAKTTLTTYFACSVTEIHDNCIMPFCIVYAITQPAADRKIP